MDIPICRNSILAYPTVPFQKQNLNMMEKAKRERRFALTAGGQSIFYVLDSFDQLKKMFWVSEGLTMNSFDQWNTETLRSSKKSKENKKNTKIQNSLDSNFSEELESNDDNDEDL